ncbi:MAG TPA: NUDIX hydrolase [Cytophagaceae bacterium]|jgi:8-oxo-dGTP diphosphatase
MYQYEYPRPAITVDIVLFGLDHLDLEVLLIKRKNDPFKNFWALPGGFLEMNETVIEGARRELKEETDLTIDNLVEIHSFSAIDRDPRERIITVAHSALIRKECYKPKGADDAKEARWFSLDRLPELAADHLEIISQAHKRLKQLSWFTPLLQEVLPEKCTSSDLVNAYTSFHKENFERTKLLERLHINENIISLGKDIYSFNDQSFAKEFK